MRLFFYMKGFNMQFPKMNSGEFPHIDNVNVNQWVNEFDYSRYDYTQMQIQICAVPWDMGEAHIGNRTISGIGNVVWFETKAKRDAWFDAIPDNKCFRFESKYKELHRDHFIDVPLPFDIASTYNYVRVKYSLFANDNSPVLYENPDGHREWFWFVREVEFLAPNTTRLHLLEDAFQTWMYDVNVSGMMLERGHAPMFETSVDDYLANPIGNAKNLLTEDVNYGTNDVAKASHEIIFNAGNMYALIITNANPLDTWGSKTGSFWRTPGIIYANNTVQGIPSYFAFVMAAGDLATFMTNIQTYIPQFMQTVKCVAFVSSDLVTLGDWFSFADINCYKVSSSYVDNDLFESFEKNEFGYDEKYADIAKLYTWPYAYIVATDESGNESIIRIENTDGHISLQTSVNLVYPWLNVTGHISGVGKAAGKTITFTNVSSRTMPIQGNWYEYLAQWNIPTFGVYQDACMNNDYATHFDRVQRVNDYTTAQTNENAIADTSVSNTAIANAANSTTTAYSNQSAYDVASYAVAYNYASAAASNQYIGANATSTIAANEQQGSVSAGASAASGVTSAIGSAIGGNPIGAVGALVNGVIGAASTMASTTIANGLTYSQSGNAIANNSSQAAASNSKTNSDTAVQAAAASNITATQNDMNTAITANNAATQKANAARSATNSQAAIDNQVYQSGLNVPAEFGSFNNGDTAATRPQGLFANIVTQTDAAISAAGDEMLRYGYMLDKFWEFDGNWNVGKYFTYWKLKDFWVSNLNVPDMYMDRLRFFLMGGVTVWRRPEDIGQVTIYDNL